MTRTGSHSDGVPFIAFHVARASGEVIAAREDDVVVYAASTVKLAVLVAAARELDAGTASLTEELVATRTFTSQVPGAGPFTIEPDDTDEGLPPDGTPMPLADVAERMIVVSSNEATNMMIERVGFAACNRALADAGCADSVLSRLYCDLAAAGTGGPSHRVTARDLARLMGAVVTGRLASPERTAWMLDLLSRQTDRQLTASFPDDVPFGSKSGWVDGIRHDVAFLGEPGPDALVVAVCTRGYENHDAEEAIRALGAMASATRGLPRAA
ncbi:serine hydrolase [Myceligenerans pegani]|uniref:Serine hydrolase n=1 Tax=Myceligenerans pegani TaxID=2776917 RepID=A0ABR9MTF9_9MICO|nr:serine hydrolase [Myceligenerans sp. TRM 65318]MBE1874649.1 serine hydrolase [Myceligenerans sp. TRM 65318]MBE3016920.1 serine hydrolase [Myceligenerans sp. TRM 65318]